MGNHEMTKGQCAQKPFGIFRWASVLLRSIHVAAMAIVLGGAFFAAEHETICAAIWAALISGGLIFFMDIIKSPRIFLQGSGLAVLLKLALLAVGFFILPGQRFRWYLAATIVASVGSHMPGAMRHCDILKACRKGKQA